MTMKHLSSSRPRFCKIFSIDWVRLIVPWLRETLNMRYIMAAHGGEQHAAAHNISGTILSSVPANRGAEAGRWSTVTYRISDISKPAEWIGTLVSNNFGRIVEFEIRKGDQSKSFKTQS